MMKNVFDGVKYAVCAVGVFVAMNASAVDYRYIPFQYGIPVTFTIENADGKALREDVYNKIKLDKAWTYGEMPNHGYVAFSPTRNEDASGEENRMILPSTTVSSADAMVVWDARSMHRHFAETYRVEARVTGSTEWTTLYACDGEDYRWVTRRVSLAGYLGKDVDIAFTATTSKGFMLAVDNIEVGVPKEKRFSFENNTPHFVTPGEDFAIKGVLSNNGCRMSFDRVEAVVDNNVVGTQSLGALEPGESAEICIPLERGVEAVDYTLRTVDANSAVQTIAEDYMVSSAVKRTVLLDCCTGTWCNNCPQEAVRTNAMEYRFGDEMIIIEDHMSDAFASIEYNYANSFIFGIPALVVNHNKEAVLNSSLTGGYEAELRRPATVAVKAVATRLADGNVKVASRITSTEAIENASDRYRLAYVLLADFRIEGSDNIFRQENSAANYTWEEYYYQPSKILPMMNVYRNVPVTAKGTTNGVEGSLPASMSANQEYEAEETLQVPDCLNTLNALKISEDASITAVVMVLDSQTGVVLNCSKVEAGIDTSIGNVASGRPDAGAVRLYDMQGRLVQAPGKGIYIQKSGSMSRKVIFK